MTPCLHTPRDDALRGTPFYLHEAPFVCEIGGIFMANGLYDTICMCILACAGVRKAPLRTLFSLGHCNVLKRLRP